MANLVETISYDAGIYQLETTDPVQGGASGVSNTPLKSLANRTAYLKKHVDDIESGATVPAGMAKLDSPDFTGSPTAPTPALGDSSTKIATTAFVQNTHAGVLSKSVAGNSTVTLSNIEAGNGILVFTGALTGNIAVLVPTKSGNWIVANRTTGAFTLTVKTAAGSGIAISQGKNQELICDGTNVVQSTSDFKDTALTGTPTAPTSASGSNDTSVATTSFVFNAIDGFASVNVAGGSNVVLTAAQSGTAIISLTGALTANISVIVPSQSGQWSFINATSGGFTITAKMATGSGVALPQGRAVHVYSDGTNVGFANEYATWGVIGGSISNQTDLQSALNGKSNTGHTHAASDITSGVLATARLGTGTANTTTFLRGDGTWGVVPIPATTWGSITGTLSSQTDLQSALNAKADSSAVGSAAGTATWGGIGGTLSNQADLQSALNAKAPSSAAGTATWGSIGGTLSSQTDLQNALNAKATLAAANTFTGQVTAPSFNTSSSLRYKNDIAALDSSDALALLAGIELVSYRMKADDSIQYGVIAEKLVGTPLDFVVNRNEQGEPDSVNYQSLFILAACALQGVADRLDRVEALLLPVR